MSVKLNNVEFFYPQSPYRKIIDINSWSVLDGKKHFIFGPSGAGKSTFLNLISGLYSPAEGSICVLGEQLEKMTTRKRNKFRAKNIGYIFQKFNLINYLSAIENIQLAYYFSKNKHSPTITQRIHTLLELLAINDDSWHRPVSQLSFGQQQRIGIARAFINKPKLIIADEPTSSLDEPSRDNFMSLLTSMCDEFQSTLLFVSHDTRLKKHFDSVQNFTEMNNMAS